MIFIKLHLIFVWFVLVKCQTTTINSGTRGLVSTTAAYSSTTVSFRSTVTNNYQYTYITSGNTINTAVISSVQATNSIISDSSTGTTNPSSPGLSSIPQYYTENLASTTGPVSVSYSGFFRDELSISVSASASSSSISSTSTSSFPSSTLAQLNTNPSIMTNQHTSVSKEAICDCSTYVGVLSSTKKSLDTNPTVTSQTSQKTSLTSLTTPTVTTTKPSSLSYLISSSNDSTINIWNITNGQLVKTIKAHQAGINSIALSNDNCLASSSKDNTIKTWNLVDFSMMFNISVNNSMNVQFINNTHILSQNRDSVQSINIKNASHIKSLVTVVNSSDSNTNFKILNDSSILTSSWYSLRILSTTYLTQSKSIPAIEALVICVLPNNNFLTGHWDKNIRIWSRNTGTILAILKGHNGPVTYIELLRNSLFASASTFIDSSTGYSSGDSRIFIWSLTAGELVRLLSGHTNYVNRLQLLQNGNLASSSLDNTIKIWNPNTGSLLYNLKGHTAPILQMLVLSNGLLATGSVDMTIKVWNVVNGSIVYVLTGHTSDVTGLCQLGLRCDGFSKNYFNF